MPTQWSLALFRSTRSGADTTQPHTMKSQLSGAKSELQGKTVGVYSSYKKGGQPPYNSALRSLQMCLLVHV